MNNQETITNSKNFHRAMFQLWTDTVPRDVSVAFMVNGQLESYAYGNLKKMWDTVPSVVAAELSKNFLVDSVNGDDNNVGSAASPFKTLEKAFSKVLENGKSKLYLKYGGEYLVSKDLGKSAAVIEIAAYGDSTLPKPIIKSLSYVHSSFPDRTLLYTITASVSGSLFFESINFKHESEIDNKPFPANNFGSCQILLNGASFVSLNNCEGNIGGVGNMDFITISHYFTNVSVNFHNSNFILGDNFLVNNRSQAPLSYMFFSGSIAANNSTLMQQIKFIARTSSGRALNVISNLNFDI